MERLNVAVEGVIFEGFWLFIQRGDGAGIRGVDWGLVNYHTLLSVFFQFGYCNGSIYLFPQI